MYMKCFYFSGNPHRYQSGAVIRMSAMTGRRRDTCLETPVEDIETEGDRQLKVLLKRQLDTDVTLKEYVIISLITIVSA